MTLESASDFASSPTTFFGKPRAAISWRNAEASDGETMRAGSPKATWPTGTKEPAVTLVAMCTTALIATTDPSSNTAPLNTAAHVGVGADEDVATERSRILPRATDHRILDDHATLTDADESAPLRCDDSARQHDRASSNITIT